MTYQISYKTADGATQYFHLENPSKSGLERAIVERVPEPFRGTVTVKPIQTFNDLNKFHNFYGM